ncbi:MAG TPA: DUF134 domain-containing protein [Candidatus Omnitrophota bacterium]|nr:DUF134 domain-containing protein [Candidatus Omnitrophota bacterium]HRY85360.1 DUF134 domain-containing protein [Candidatus Omnitrophota bacterium]
MRPKKIRQIGCKPGDRCFRPVHVPRKDVVVTRITLDELEALRLCDGMRLEQNAAARKMKVHRSTVSRILTAARKKVANALVHHHGIKIEGGRCKMKGERS